MQSKGFFRGTVIDGAVSVTKNGYAQAVIKVHADEMYDEEAKEWGPWEEFDWEPNEIDDREAIVYACIFGSKGATFVVDDLKKIFSWDPEDGLGALDSLMTEGVKIQWAIDWNTYDGETKLKADGIKGYDDAPGGSLKKLDAKALKELDAKFAGFLKGETKPATAVKSKRKARKATTDADKPEAPVEETKTEEAKDDKPKRGARGSKAGAKTKAPVEDAPAAPTMPAEEDETVEEQADAVFDNIKPCTKAEAWFDVNAAKSDKTTDAEVVDAWKDAVQKVGGGKKHKELSDEEWSSVRAATIDVVAIPF